MKPLTCPVCKQQHWPKGQIRWKYCSKRCYDAKRAEFWAPIDLACEGCGRTFQRASGTIRKGKKGFCSHACFLQWNVGAHNPMFRGERDYARGRGWASLAEKIRRLDDYTCRRCGRTQQENKRRLEVDHILPWRVFTDKALANAPANLASLCTPCHRYKTAVIEARWFKGDALEMDRYMAVVRRPETRP